MIKTISTVLFLTTLLMSACCGDKKVTTDAKAGVTEKNGIDSIPACVRQIIDAGSKEEPANLPVQVDEYLYKGEKVYLFTAPCCDQFDQVYDANCNKRCAPTGGITGKGDGACPDFATTATFTKLIWKGSSQK
jgi:hypothetical protein